MTKVFIYMIILTLGIFPWMSCSSQVAQGPAQMDPEKFGEEVSVETVAAHKGHEGVVVIDVREPDEYADAHIPGVVLIPKGQALDRKAEYIDSKVVFVTCRSGHRSKGVTDELRAQGYTNVHSMAGGILAWQAMGLPVEKGK